MNTDQEVVAGLRACAGPLTKQVPSMDVEGLGSCFVIAALGHAAIAVTARHCVDEAKEHAVKTHVPSAPGSPFQIERKELSWKGVEIGTLLHHEHVPAFLSMGLPLEALEVYKSIATDVAFLLLRPAIDYQFAQLKDAVACTETEPLLGEDVIVAGYFDTDVSATHHRESDGRAAFVAVRASYQLVKAKILEIHPSGQRYMRWPVFKLSCPLYSGMSGGCVLARRAGQWRAVGVVCSDLAHETAAAGAEAYASWLTPALDTILDGPKWLGLGQSRTTMAALLKPSIT